MADTPVGDTVAACATAGEHLLRCDNDGYCSACGHQGGGWDDYDEHDLHGGILDELAACLLEAE